MYQIPVLGSVVVVGESKQESKVFLFSLNAPELGWDLSAYPEDVRHVMHSLPDAMAADLAEILAEKQMLHVTLYSSGEMQFSEAGIRHVQRTVLALGEQIQDAVRCAYAEGSVVPVIVLLEQNPLYPVRYVTEAASLLGCEDDVVVFQQREEDVTTPFVLLGTNMYHPGMAPGTGTPEVALAGLLAALPDTMVVPFLPWKKRLQPDRLGYLYHEIERKVLLAQRVPARTYALLRKLVHRGIIGGVQ